MTNLIQIINLKYEKTVRIQLTDSKKIYSTNLIGIYDEILIGI